MGGPEEEGGGAVVVAVNSNGGGSERVYIATVPLCNAVTNVEIQPSQEFLDHCLRSQL